MHTFMLASWWYVRVRLHWDLFFREWGVWLRVWGPLVCGALEDIFKTRLLIWLLSCDLRLLLNVLKNKKLYELLQKYKNNKISIHWLVQLGGRGV